MVNESISGHLLDISKDAQVFKNLFLYGKHLKLEIL